MSKSTDNFFNKLLYFFPDVKREYNMNIEEYGERLDTIVIEDIFMPKIISLLCENQNISLLNEIFEYFEEVLKSDNAYLVNIMTITILEVLGNDKVILAKAQKYMGAKTKEMQIEADRGIGRFN